MLRRLARWYGTGTDDFIIAVLGIAGLAATMAAWMLVDHGDPARAAVAAAGALMLALPRTARRLARRPAHRLLLSSAAGTLAIGTMFFGLFWEPLAALYGAGYGVYAGLVLARLDSAPARIDGRQRTKRGDRALERSLTVDLSPVVAQTRVVSVVLRIVMAAAMLGGWVAVVLYDELGGIEDFRGVVFAVGGLPLVLYLLCHRVRERMTLDDDGLTLWWSPLSLGPLPLLRREVFVPWSRVHSVELSAGYTWVPSQPSIVPTPRLYLVRLTVEKRAVTWRLGWHTSGTRAAIAFLASRLRARAVAPEVRDEVREWRAAGVV